MTPQFSIKHNLNEALVAYMDVPDKLLNQAAPRALNATATTVRAEAARLIGKTWNMKVGAAKGQMNIVRATRAKLVAKIVVSGRPIPLIEFDARPNVAQSGGKGQRNVSVRVKGQRKQLRNAFIATMKSGHRGIFVRVNAGKSGGRLPIKELFSLSLPVAFTQKQIMDALRVVSAERFNETLRQQMRFVQLKAA